MRTFGSDKSSTTGWYYDLNTDPGETFWDTIVPSHPTGGIWNNSFNQQNPDFSTADAIESLSQYIPGDVLGLLGLGSDDVVPPNSGNNQPPNVPQVLDYLDAPYAQHYGMSAETAYQEALANTAYQRKVKDLKAAGLNPVLGINGAGSAAFGGSLTSSGSAGSSSSGKDTSSFEWTDALPYLGAAVGLMVGFKTKMKPANMANAANIGWNLGKAADAFVD